MVYFFSNNEEKNDKNKYEDDFLIFEKFNKLNLDYELAKQIQREELEGIQKEKGKGKEEERENKINLDYELAKQIQREELEGIQKEKGKGKEEERGNKINLENLDYELAQQIEVEEMIKMKSNEIYLDHEVAKQIEKEERERIHKKCEICLENFSLLDGTNYFLNCNCVIHNICFDNMIRVAIESNNLPVKCPNCNTSIHPNYIIDSINNANPDLLKKYEKYSINNFLMNNNDEFSPCPTPGCEYIFFFQQGEFNFLCPMCHKHYCLNCKDEWHNGLTCQQYKDSRDEKKLDDQFFQFVKGAKFKMCPKCKYWVEKTRGCNHMRCRCGADFCYLCGDFMNMNTNHTCRR